MKILKYLIGAAGLVALIGAIAFVAHDGYATGATPASRIINALAFSLIALAGMAGPALAYRLCRSPRMRTLGILVGLISAAALTASVAHFVAKHDQQSGASPARRIDAPASATVSSRTSAGADKDENELNRLTAERSALYFSPTSQAAIGAARAEFIDINDAYSAQCDDEHGAKCDELAAELTAKRDVFLAAVSDRTATLRAEELDAKIAGIRARLAPKSPLLDIQSARQRASDSVERSTWQQGALVLIGEFAIAFALIVWSIPDVPSSPAPIHRSIGDIRTRGRSRVPSGEEDLARFVYECMSRARGERAPLRALYLRFLDWCDEQRLSPLPPRKFSQAVVKCCAEAQIEVCHDGSDVVCLNVRLAPTYPY